MTVPRTEPGSGGSGSSWSQPAVDAGSAFQSRPEEAPVAIAIVAIVGTVFVWWAWKQGAYFGSVFFPGAMLLYALLVLLLLAAPFKAQLRGPARVSLAAILALVAWTLLSIAWTSDHDGAVQYAEHEALYAAVFVLGLWSCNLAGRRMLVPLAAVALAGGVIGFVITLALAIGTDVTSYVHSDATLRFPIGYRNAEAAFLLICFWPMIVLAAEGELPWQLRALLIGAATMLLELTVLAESRGSLAAAAVALPVFLALCPRRLRAAAYLGLAALPVLPVLPVLLDVFAHGHGGPGLLPLLRDSARAILLSSLGSVVLAAVCIRGIEIRLDLGGQRVKLLSRITAIVAIAVVVAGGIVFVAERGGPVKFLDQRVREFNQGSAPNLQPKGTRFGVNVASNRGDFWRVSLNQGRDHPLLGAGAGSFGAAYTQNRHSDETPHDPHSVEMLMLSELGIVGLLLFGTFIVSAGLGALRSRSLGPAAAALTAGSLGSATYWLVHASYDWFWNYPGITAPVMFLLGTATAPAAFAASVRIAGRARAVAVGIVAVALLAAIPLFFSQRYASRAYGEYPSKAAAALSDLDRAADLNPYDPEPLLAKGVIESRLGRNAAAVSAFRQAIDRQPDAYAGHFFLARVLARTDLAAARAEARAALRLNPLDLQTRALARSLNRARA